MLQFGYLYRNSSAIFRKRNLNHFLRPPSLSSRGYKAILIQTSKQGVTQKEIKLGSLLRRFLSENADKLSQTTKTNNISRLFTLAKPEKWKLMGRYEVEHCN